MKKRVLVISTSLRKNSNSDALCEAFILGARQAGHEVEKVSLIGKEMGFCTGCLSCQTTRCCVMKDDASKIVAKMGAADVLAFATPIYFYEMCGQMKTLLDRSNPLFADDYSFRHVYLLMAAAEEEKAAMDGAIQGLKGWIDCFDKAQLSAVTCAAGFTEPGALIRAPDIREEARAMGAAIA